MTPIVEGRARLPGGSAIRIVGIDLLSDPSLGGGPTRSEGEFHTDWTRQEFWDLLLDPSAIILSEDLARQLAVKESSPLRLLVGQQWISFRIGTVIKSGAVP